MKNDLHGIRDFIKGRLNEDAKDITMSDDMVLSRTRDIAGGVVRALTHSMRTDGFSIKCDTTNNTQEMIDNNVLSIDIAIHDPRLTDLLIRGNDNAKTSVRVIVQKEEDATQKDL